MKITCDAGGLKLKNPAILAAGVLGTTGASLKRVAAMGAGAVFSATCVRDHEHRFATSIERPANRRGQVPSREGLLNERGAGFNDAFHYLM